MDYPLDFDYHAFIVHSSQNKDFVNNIYKELKRYKVPRSVIKECEKHGESILPAFGEILVDDTVIPVGVELDKDLRERIEKSKFLIVVCSREAVKSKYVELEIDHFIKERSPQFILPVVINGTPSYPESYDGDDSEQCLPKSLRFIDKNEKKEALPITLYGDFRKKPLSTGKILTPELLAGLLGVDTNRVKLWQSQEQTRRIKIGTAIGLPTLTLFGFLTLSAILSHMDAQENAKRAQDSAERAQFNLSVSKVTTAQNELAAGRIRAAGQAASDAYATNPNWHARLALWDVLSRLPTLKVSDPHRPLLGKGLLYAKTLDRIIGISGKKVVFIHPDGLVEEIPHPVGTSLSSILTSDESLLFILGVTGKLVSIDLRDKKIISETDHKGCTWMGGAGQRLALGCQGGLVQVYQVKDGQPEPIFEKHFDQNEKAQAPVVAISTQGDQLAVGMNHSIVLWSLEQNRELWKTAISGNPAGIAISGDDRRMAWFALDGQTALADVKTGGVLQDLSQKGAAVFSIGFSPDASRLAMTVSWSSDTNRSPSLIELDLASGKESLIFEASERMQQLAYKNADEILALIPSGAIYQITRSPLRHAGPGGLPIQQLVSRLDRHDSTVVAFRCGQSGDAGVDRTKDQIMANFAQPQGALRSETQCLMGSGQLERYDLPKTIPAPIAGTTATTAAVLLNNGHYLVGTTRGEVRDIDPTDARTFPIFFQSKSKKPISYLGFFEPNSVVLEESFSSGESGIYSISGNTLTPMLSFHDEALKGTAFTAGHITRTAYSLQHKVAMIFFSSVMQGGPGESRLLVYDPVNNKIVKSVYLQGGVVRDIQWLADSQQWALAQGDGKIAFMEDGTWKITGTLDNGMSPVISLLVLKDRSGPPVLVAGDSSGSLTFWTTQNHERLYATLPSGKPITGLRYDADQDLLIVAAGDKLSLWQGMQSVASAQSKMKSSFDYVVDAISRFSTEKNNGHLDLALESLNKAIDERPWDVNLLSERVSLYRGRKEFDKAITDQDHQLKSNTGLIEEMDHPNGSDAIISTNLTLKGIILQEWWDQSHQVEHIVQSLQTFLEVLKMDPSNLIVHFYMLSELVSSGHFKGVEQAGKQLALVSEKTKHPVKPMAFGKLAFVAALWNDYEKAIPQEIVKEIFKEQDQSLSSGNRVMRDLLLHRSVSPTEIQSIDKPREMALVQFLLGLEQQSRKDLKQAREHFQKGMEKEDYFGINQQALARLDGKWQASSVPQESIDQYHTLLGQWLAKADQKQ